MADGYEAGEAFLQIVPSFRGVAAAIDREAGKWGRSAGREYARRFNEILRAELRNIPMGPGAAPAAREGQKTGGAFADGFRTRVDAALRSLPDIELHANSTAAEARIATLRAKLQELSDARIGVDVSAEDAIIRIDDIKRQLDELGASSPDVQVRMDTAAAAARLAEIQAQVRELDGQDPEVDVHVDDHGSSAATTRSVNGLVAALISAAPLAVAVGAALAGGLAGALAVAGALVGAVATLGLGLAGTKDTVKLLDQRDEARKAKPTGGGGGSPGAAGEVNSARQIRDAQQSVTDARRQAARAAQDQARKVADAQRNLADVEQRVARDRIRATRDVADAQRDLADATAKVLDAETALADARKEAQRDLEDSANAAVDANLAQQQALADLAAAQQNYNLISGSEARTDAEKQQAALELAQAQQAVVEGNQRAARAAEDNNAAQKAGVDGSKKVVDATKQVGQAQRDQSDAATRVKDTQAALAETQRQGARDVADAQRDVATAVREQSRSQQDSARQIARAQQGVADAMQSAAVASAAAGAAGASAIDGINDKLANTNPAVLKFANFLRDSVRPQIDKLKATAAKNLLPGLQSGITVLSPLLPVFNRIVGNIATTLGGLATEAGKALNSPVWRQFFDFIARSAGPIIDTFARVIGNLATGFAGLLPAFEPIIKLVGNGLLSLSRAFADFGKNAANNSGFQAFLRYIADVGPVVARTIGNLFRIFGQLFAALAPLGAVMARVAEAVTGFLASLNPDQLLIIVGAIGALVTALGGPLVGAVIAVTALAALIARNWSKVAPAFAPVVAIGRNIVGAFKALYDFAKPLVEEIARGLVAAFGLLLRVIRPVTAAFAGAARFIRDHGTLFRSIAVAVLAAVAAYKIYRIGLAVTAAVQRAFAAAQLLINAAMNANPIVLVVTAIAALAAGLAYAYTHSETFRNIVSSIGDVFVFLWHNVLEPVVDFFRNNWRTVLAIALLPLLPFIAAAKLIIDNWSGIVGFFKDLWSSITGFFSAAVSFVVNVFQTAWGVAKTIVTAPIEAAKVVISTVWGAIRGAFSAAKDWVVGTFKAAWNLVRSIITTPVSLARDAVKTVWGGIRGFFSGGKDWVVGTFKSAWSVIESVIKKPVQLAGDAISTVWDGIKSGVRVVSDVIQRIWSGLKRIFASPINFVIDTVYNHGIRAFWNTIVGAVGLDSLKLPEVAKIKANADGNVYSPRGRENHVAQIAPAGAWRVWAEDETGGEAYIPLHPSKRRRSRAIATETVSRLGGVAYFARGGTAGTKPIDVTKVKKPIGSVADDAFDSLGKAVDWIKTKIGGAFRSILDHFGTGTRWLEVIGRAPLAMGGKAIDGLIEFVKDIFRDAGAGIKGLNRDAAGKAGLLRGQHSKTAPTRGGGGAVAIADGAILENRVKHTVFDQGGALPTGLSHVFNGTGAPELIAPPSTFQQIIERAAAVRGQSGDGQLFGDTYITQRPHEDAAELAARVGAQWNFKLLSMG